MKLIIGLGNPGKQYEHTRHNAGFLALDYFMADGGWRMADLQNNFQSRILETSITGQKIIFAKPQTFMNESGRAVLEFANFYKLDPETDLLIIHDDCDLPLGAVKPALDSTSAGHKGVQSIIDLLRTQKFHRLRIGVETRDSRLDLPTEAFVLQNFTENELKILRGEVFPKVAAEIQNFLA